MGKVIVFVVISMMLTFFGGYWIGLSTRDQADISKSNNIARRYLITEMDVYSAIQKEKETERVVYREITKYIKDPDRNVCKFDPDAVRLRQQAIDAANSIPGFDVPAVQNK